MQAYREGREQELAPPQPFRNFVAQARLGIPKQEHEEYFRQMLGDVSEPTAPFGVLQVHGDGSEVQEEHQMLESALSQRIRRQARQLGGERGEPVSLCVGAGVGPNGGQRGCGVRDGVVGSDARRGGI